MKQTSVKIRNGAIVLPKEARKLWRNADAVARISPDAVVIKRLQPSSFWDTWEQVGTLKPRVTKKDITQAITQVRSKTNHRA